MNWTKAIIWFYSIGMLIFIAGSSMVEVGEGYVSPYENTWVGSDWFGWYMSFVLISPMWLCMHDVFNVITKGD